MGQALFTPATVYRAQAQGTVTVPLAAIYLDGHGMMADRITRIEKTLVFAPRSTRHHRPAGARRRCMRATPFIVAQTVGSQPPDMLATGCYHDTLVATTEGLRLAARNAVYDNARSQFTRLSL